MMPNKTIYVADADAPLYDRAQALAGGNLSAAIADALRQFVEGANSADDWGAPGAARASGGSLEPVIVRVGKGGAYTQKRFSGRLLGKQHIVSTPSGSGATESLISYRVYQTEKGHFALYLTEGPNWSGDWRAWGNWGGGGRDKNADRRARQEERSRRRGGGAPWDWRGYAGYAGYADGWGDAPEPPAPPTPLAEPDAPVAGLASPAGAARRDGVWWESTYRLEVYDTLDDLRAHLPAELAAVVAQALSGAEIEDLDI